MTWESRNSREKTPRRIAALSGANYHDEIKGNVALSFDFLNRNIVVSWPELDFSYSTDGDEVPIQQQVLLLHYLNLAADVTLSEEWVAYQEVPGRQILSGRLSETGQNPNGSGLWKQS